MKNLKHVLESEQPRERSGGWTIARYDFQTNFSILEILKLHGSGADYCALFDYFDDLFVMSGPPGAKRAAFYQVKAKASGTWSSANFCRIEKGKASPTSIIGKMQFNISQFGLPDSVPTFVTNAAFNLKLTTGKYTTDDDFDVAAANLHPDEVKKIDATLDLESPPPRPHDCKANLAFKRVALGTHEQHKFVIGALTEFLAQRKSAYDVPAMAVYETLKAKIVHKSSVTKTMATMEQIVDEKGLQRKDVEDLITRAVHSKRFLDDWSMIEKELISDFTPIQTARIKTECVRYINLRGNGDPSASVLSNHFRDVAKSIAVCLQASSSFLDAQTQLLNHSIPSLTQQGSFERAAALVEAYEEIVAI
ncbi:hypothetical protein C0214_05790 [Methylobacterium sp. DM1]|nr:hypothetical protein C0214_05790 [Methylobacterium sp. DM1]